MILNLLGTIFTEIRDSRQRVRGRFEKQEQEQRERIASKGRLLTKDEAMYEHFVTLKRIQEKEYYDL